MKTRSGAPRVCRPGRRRGRHAGCAGAAGAAAAPGPRCTAPTAAAGSTIPRIFMTNPPGHRARPRILHAENAGYSTTPKLPTPNFQTPNANPRSATASRSAVSLVESSLGSWRLGVCWSLGAGAWRVDCAVLGRLRVLDDEEHLARLDQPELLAGERFDGAGVGPQPPGLVAEPGVFDAQPFDRPSPAPDAAAAPAAFPSGPRSPTSALITSTSVTNTSSICSVRRRFAWGTAGVAARGLRRAGAGSAMSWTAGGIFGSPLYNTFVRLNLRI